MRACRSVLGPPGASNPITALLAGGGGPPGWKPGIESGTRVLYRKEASELKLNVDYYRSYALLLEVNML